MENLIPFIDSNVNLLIAKRKVYEVFKEIVLRLSRKEHKNPIGLKNLVILAYNLTKMNPKAKRRRDIDHVLRIIESRVARRGEPPGGR